MSKTPRRPGAAAIVLVALALWLLTPPPAAALPGPSSFSTGLVDEANFQSLDPTVRTLWFGRARALGSSWVRLGAYWNQIAPATPPAGFNASNPAEASYNFAQLDGAIRSARASRQNVLVQLLGPPTWALSPGAPPGTYPGTWRPRPSALAAFARAVALRYSGRFPDPLSPGHRLPRAAGFQVWNEPNLPTYLSPQWVRGRGGRGWVPASPAIYRTMLNAAYRAIKAVQPHTMVMAAGTAPYGDPPGVDRMAPVVFVRELLCLHGPALRRERCPDPAHFDAIDHHPYGPTPTLHAFRADDVSVPDLGKLSHILRRARRLRTVQPGGPKPLWVTEIFWDSKPPDGSSPISLARQAHYVSLAFYELWRQGVSHVLWFILRDIRYKLLTGAGLYFGAGAAKPSAAAYRFPFVALRSGRVVTLWGKAPQRGSVIVERFSGRRWRLFTRLRTAAGAVFYSRRSIRAGHLTLRARESGVISPSWSTG